MVVTIVTRAVRAGYARYSTGRQNPLSTQDQLEKCRQFASAHGWRFLEDHVYTDEEISGATLDRPGLRLLRAAVKSKPRPFDVLLIEPASRLSPKRADVLNLCEERNFHPTQFFLLAQNRWEMVPRGGVELPTPAFSGPRSTGELPRHRHNTRFYGKQATCVSSPLYVAFGVAGDKVPVSSRARKSWHRVRGVCTKEIPSCSSARLRYCASARAGRTLV